MNKSSRQSVTDKAVRSNENNFRPQLDESCGQARKEKEERRKQREYRIVDQTKRGSMRFKIYSLKFES